MTDRTKCLTVMLDGEYRTDDVEVIKSAISMIKGVISVDHNVSDWSMHTAITSVKWDLRKQIADIFKD